MLLGCFVNLLPVYFTASDRRKLIDGFIPVIHLHKERKRAGKSGSFQNIIQDLIIYCRNKSLAASLLFAKQGKRRRGIQRQSYEIVHWERVYLIG